MKDAWHNAGVGVVWLPDGWSHVEGYIPAWTPQSVLGFSLTASAKRGWQPSRLTAETIRKYCTSEQHSLILAESERVQRLPVATVRHRRSAVASSEDAPFLSCG